MFRSCLLSPIPVRPWAGSFASMNLHFFSHEMEIRVPVLHETHKGTGSIGKHAVKVGHSHQHRNYYWGGCCHPGEDYRSQRLVPWLVAVCLGLLWRGKVRVTEKASVLESGPSLNTSGALMPSMAPRSRNYGRVSVQLAFQDPWISVPLLPGGGL